MKKTYTPEESVIKDDLESKIKILNQIKQDFADANEEVLSRFSIGFPDRSISLVSYLEKAERKTAYGFVSDKLIELLSPRIDFEIGIHIETLNALGTEQ